MKAKLTLDKDFVIGSIDDRLYGSFIEHLGRAVYNGIWEPGHPTADDEGFRGDVLRLVRELDVPVVRYPGGNFVSAYDWEDGIGPRDARPRRLDLAWKSLETNQIGINEFVSWSRKAHADVMLAVNLGSRGIDGARSLLEYCNFPAGSYWADLRISHGYKEPHNVKLWCLGNEMDGPWQVGHRTAFDYGRLADETAKAMKYFDRELEVVACGSSNSTMPTFPEWEKEVLDECYDSVDYISLHAYLRNDKNQLPSFLGSPLIIEKQIETVAQVCDYVKAKKRSAKTLSLSFDEWNVWYHSGAQDRAYIKEHPWSEAPPLLEDIYNFEDALVVGGIINAFIRHADRVKIACLAQLVNVIAPIMTETGGSAWRQTTYYPFFYASRYGRGTALASSVICPEYDTDEYGAVPYLDTSVVFNEEKGELAFFLINRSQDEALDVNLRLGGFPAAREMKHISMTHRDMKAVNTAAKPDNVVPVEKELAPPKGESFTITVPELSWNCYVIKV